MQLNMKNNNKEFLLRIFSQLLTLIAIITIGVFEVLTNVLLFPMFI